MARDRRSRDQKRKAKLVQRSRRQAPAEPLAYHGKKYQADFWVPHVFETEKAVYEAIKLSHEQLTNAQVKTAFVQLIEQLRSGQPGPLAEGELEIVFAAGKEVESLIWNIRRHWRILVEEVGPVAADDLIGILRTLLGSIEAHGRNTGAARGYVHFLVGFMERGEISRGRIPSGYFQAE
jgi:hypothetical protein